MFQLSATILLWTVQYKDRWLSKRNNENTLKDGGKKNKDFSSVLSNSISFLAKNPRRALKMHVLPHLCFLTPEIEHLLFLAR